MSLFTCLIAERANNGRLEKSLRNRRVAFAGCHFSLNVFRDK
jgi:hypothetical protein